MISGFRREEDEIYFLPRYYAAYGDNSLLMFRDSRSVPISKGQGIQIFDFWTLISIDSFLVPCTLGGSSPLHGEKGLEGTTFHNANTQKGNSNTKSLVYMSLVRPILEYGAVCWDPHREGQITALDRVQKKAAKFAPQTNSSVWENLGSRIKLSRICASRRKLPPLNKGCTRLEVSIFNGKINMFNITDINSFFVHITYWKMMFSLSFDWLSAIISLSICPIRKQTTAEISSTFCHHPDATIKSKPITKSFSLDLSSSHRALNITYIAVVVGSFSDTSIRRVVEGLKS